MQVKLFLLEESPSQVGLSAQDHLQAKTSWLSHSSGTGSDDNLPPGFESAHPASQLQIDLSQIPLIRWKTPPRVNMNSCIIFIFIFVIRVYLFIYVF